MCYRCKNRQDNKLLSAALLFLRTTFTIVFDRLSSSNSQARIVVSHKIAPTHRTKFHGTDIVCGDIRTFPGLPTEATMSLFEHAEFGRAAVVIGPAISVVAFSIIFGRHSAGLGGTLVGVRVVVTAADGIVVRGTGSCAGGHVGADSRSALISAVGNIEQAELVIVAIASGMTVDNVTFAIMLQANSRTLGDAFVRVRLGVAAAYLLDVHGTCHIARNANALALLAFVAAVGKIELAEFVGIAFVVGVAAQVTIIAAG